ANTVLDREEVRAALREQMTEMGVEVPKDFDAEIDRVFALDTRRTLQNADNVIYVRRDGSARDDREGDELFRLIDRWFDGGSRNRVSRAIPSAIVRTDPSTALAPNASRKDQITGAMFRRIAELKRDASTIRIAAVESYFAGGRFDISSEAIAALSAEERGAMGDAGFLDTLRNRRGRLTQTQARRMFIDGERHIDFNGARGTFVAAFGSGDRARITKMGHALRGLERLYTPSGNAPRPSDLVAFDTARVPAPTPRPDREVPPTAPVDVPVAPAPDLIEADDVDGQFPSWMGEMSGDAPVGVLARAFAGRALDPRPYSIAVTSGISKSDRDAVNALVTAHLLATGQAVPRNYDFFAKLGESRLSGSDNLVLDGVEWDAVIDELEEIDRNGKSNSIAVTEHGQPTRLGRVLQILARNSIPGTGRHQFVSEYSGREFDFSGLDAPRVQGGDRRTARQVLTDLGVTSATLARLQRLSGQSGAHVAEAVFDAAASVGVNPNLLVTQGANGGATRSAIAIEMLTGLSSVARVAGIQRSVGMGGVNADADVRRVQERLIELGYYVGPNGADGDWGRNTRRALKHFRAVQTSRGINLSRVGRVRVENSDDVLFSSEARRWMSLPASGPGWVSQDIYGGHHYGHQVTLDFLNRLGRAYEAAGHTRPFATNDISNAVGPSRSHASHENGFDIDFRLPRRDGRYGGTTVGRADQDALEAMLRAVARDPGVERIIIQSTSLTRRLRREFPGKFAFSPSHHQHFHVDIREID
ncbi:MAG: penicillin-insensitive murein endopeptidase, partial [Myxococcota bacterium]